MKNNLVSIIMPAYNAEHLIAESIQSVLEQSHTEWQLIVIDDCSTDRTGEIVKEFASDDNRIVYIQNNVNSGVAMTRNNGLKKVEGRYLAFLDSDDMWYPSKLSEQLFFMRANNVHFTYCSYEVVDGKSVSMGRVLNAPSKITYNSFLRGSKIGCLTVMIDLKHVDMPKMEKIGHEDYLAWATILSQLNETSGLTKVLAKYRVHGNSLSGNKVRASKWQYSIYKDQLGFSSFKSLYLFICYAINGLFKYNKIKEKSISKNNKF